MPRDSRAIIAPQENGPNSVLKRFERLDGEIVDGMTVRPLQIVHPDFNLAALPLQLADALGHIPPFNYPRFDGIILPLQPGLNAFQLLSKINFMSTFYNGFRN